MLKITLIITTKLYSYKKTIILVYGFKKKCLKMLELSLNLINTILLINKLGIRRFDSMEKEKKYERIKRCDVKDVCIYIYIVDV